MKASRITKDSRSNSGPTPCLADMNAAYEAHGGNIVAVAPVPEDQTHQYGIVGVEDAKARTSRITAMIEKPPRGTAPSNLHITGRYILQPEIFEILERRERGASGEIQLTDSMIAMSRVQPFFATRFDGRIYDCGAKIGFLTANVAYALDRPDIAPQLRAEIEALLAADGPKRTGSPVVP